MNKILAAISIVFAAGLLLAVPPSAFATQKEACTPGYWKNNTDTNGFGDLDSINLQQWYIDNYGVDLGSEANITIAEGVALKGGPLNAFLRYAAAAVYNIEAGLQYDTNKLQTALDRFEDGNLSGAIEKFELIHSESTCPIDAFGNSI